MTTRTFAYIPQTGTGLAPAGVVGPGWIAGSVPTFTQDTQPDHTGPYLWWDTSGGNLTLWIEDGN